MANKGVQPVTPNLDPGYTSPHDQEMVSHSYNNPDPRGGSAGTVTPVTPNLSSSTPAESYDHSKRGGGY